MSTFTLALLIFLTTVTAPDEAQVTPIPPDLHLQPSHEAFVRKIASASSKRKTRSGIPAIHLALPIIPCHDMRSSTPRSIIYYSPLIIHQTVRQTYPHVLDFIFVLIQYLPTVTRSVQRLPVMAADPHTVKIVRSCRFRALSGCRRKQVDAEQFSLLMHYISSDLQIKHTL